MYMLKYCNKLELWRFHRRITSSKLLHGSTKFCLIKKGQSIYERSMIEFKKCSILMLCNLPLSMWNVQPFLRELINFSIPFHVNMTTWEEIKTLQMPLNFLNQSKQINIVTFFNLFIQLMTFMESLNICRFLQFFLMEKHRRRFREEILTKLLVLLPRPIWILKYFVSDIWIFARPL